MAPVRFTCLLPVYGADDAGHFAEAVRSILCATLRPDDVVVCQDGDLPPALTAAVRAGVSDLGARLVRNPGPGGLHHNLNHALAQTRTPWIARCDADDINAPARFEVQARALAERPDVGVLGSDLMEFWPDGRERRKTMPLTHEAIVAWAKWRSPVNHNTVFYRTEDILACGGYPALPLKEDYGLWLRLIGRGVRFANLRADLVRSRLGDDFYRRRAGLKNLVSEWGLYRIRAGIPGMGGLQAAAALAMSGATRLVYERGLRR